MAKKTAKKTVKKAVRKTAKNPVKVGIIGLGRAGYGMHLNDMKCSKGHFEVVAGCDPLKSQRDRLAEKLPKARLYETYQELLKDEEVELVIVANRSLDHVQTCIDALKTGKHVVQEKPIGIDFADTKKLKKAADKAKGQLFMRQNRRFEPCFNHVKEIIASGVLGTVFEIKLARHNYQRRDDWQTLISEAGGQLNNWGPHLIDHGLRFLNCPVKEIWADLKRIAAVGDAEDHLKIIMKGESGMVIDIEISGGVSMPSPVYAVYGTKGCLISENESTIKMKYLNPKVKLKPRRAKKGTPLGFSDNSDLKWVEKEIKVKPAAKCDMATIYTYVYESIRNGKKYPIKFEEAAEVVRITEEARKISGFYPTARKTAKGKKKK